MRDLGKAAGGFIVAGIVGAGGILLLCQIIIHGLPLLARVLHALEG